MTKPTLYLGNRLDMPSFHFLILFVSAPHLLLLLRNAPPELSGRCCLIANQTIVPRCHNFWDSEQQSSLWFTADKAVWGKKSRCVFNPCYCTIPLFDFFLYNAWKQSSKPNLLIGFFWLQLPTAKYIVPLISISFAVVDCSFYLFI